jgi:ribosome maturation factor RimP
LIDRDLYELLEPGVKALGFEVLTVEKAGQGNSSVLRVYIDSPEGITVDDCARVSDQVSAILDVEDPITDRYRLEVSSPGFDRPLCTLAHFEAVVGQKVRIQSMVQIAGRKRFTGILTGVTAEVVTLDIDGEVHSVPMDNILKARLVPAR